MPFDIVRKGETRTFVMPDGALRSVVACDKELTLSYMRSEASGDVDNTHSHMHRQVVYIMQGSGLFRLDGETLEVRAGDCISIGSNAKHSFVRFFEHTEWLEFFTPGREDLEREFIR